MFLATPRRRRGQYRKQLRRARCNLASRNFLSRGQEYAMAHPEVAHSVGDAGLDPTTSTM